MGGLSLVHSVLRDSRLRRLGACYQLFALAEHGTWLAITVWAFERGGVREVGVASFVQLVPAAVVAPFAAYAGDRFRRDRVLTIGLLVVALSAAGTGTAILADAPVAAVYMAGAVTASAMTIARPGSYVILPAVTDDARGLTVAHAGIELIDNLAVFAGPAIAGLMLTRWSPGTVFIAFGAATFVGSLTMASIRFEASRVRPTGVLEGSDVVTELKRGLRLIASARDVRVTLSLLASAFVVMGALDVLFVAIALDLLEQGEGLAGFLSSASGAGGLAGAAASFALVGRARLRLPIATAALLSSLPLLAIAAAPSVASALVAMAFVGSGLALLGVAGRALVQRTTTDDVLARVFGVLESAMHLGLAFGSLAIGVLANAIGIRWALVVLASVLPVAVVVGWRGLGRADACALVADPTMVSSLRHLELFRPLSAPSLEQLAINMRPIRAVPGDEIIRCGTTGDRFYLIDTGQVEVVDPDGVVVAELGPGEFFGEVALVHDVPRTATVQAITECSLYALGREVFLSAVTGHPDVLSETERVAAARLPRSREDD